MKEEENKGRKTHTYIWTQKVRLPPPNAIVCFDLRFACLFTTVIDQHRMRRAFEQRAHSDDHRHINKKERDKKQTNKKKAVPSVHPEQLIEQTSNTTAT
jgi:hypothetical protein